MQPDTRLPKEPYYKIYTALLTQEETSAPTAIVLQNTLGITVTWTRYDVGIYKANLEGTGANYDNFHCIIITQNGAGSAQCFNEELELTTVNLAGTASDSYLSNSPIEIKIKTQ